MPSLLFRYKVILTLAIMGGAVLIDQGTKMLAGQYLSMSSGLSFFDNLVTFRLVENYGLALGLGEGFGDQFVLPALSGVFIVGLWLNCLFSMYSWPLVSAYSMVIGGGCGNLIDRIVNNGGVVDFIYLTVAGYRSLVFNFADIAIVVGLILMLVFPHSRDKNRIQKRLSRSQLVAEL